MDSSTFVKTCALVAVGAMFGYTIAKSRYGHNKAAKKGINLNDINDTENPKKILKYVRSKLKNYPPILERNFLRLDNDSAKNKDNEIRIMQWNMLARGLFNRKEQSFGQDDLFDWPNYRFWRTLEELVRFESDIICVEEADFYEEIKPYLHLIGYTSIFAPKYKSPCLPMENNIGPDGCAIFYKKDKFQIVNMGCEKVIVDSEINSQIFIILQLKHKKSGKNFTLVCIHLKSKEVNSKIRFNQIKSILDVVGKHVEGCVDDTSAHPVIMCGDFNGEPFEQFYSEIINNSLFKFRDAYTVSTDLKERTTFKMGPSSIRRAIDYIFFTQNNLQVTEILELPVNDLLLNEQGLPNVTYSSDHLSLVCNFKFQD